MSAKVPPYAHPMGYPKAFLCGAVYGLVLGGLPWIIWTAATLHHPPLQADIFMALAFGMGFTSVPMMESVERDWVKKGSTNLGKEI